MKKMCFDFAAYNRNVYSDMYLKQYLTATASISLRTLSPDSQPGLTVKSNTVIIVGSGSSLWCSFSTAWSHSSVTGQSAPLVDSSSLSDIVIHWEPSSIIYNNHSCDGETRNSHVRTALDGDSTGTRAWYLRSRSGKRQELGVVAGEATGRFVLHAPNLRRE